jgi:hypothetical protein
VASNAKLFSGAAVGFGAGPNEQVSLVDAGFPGMLPTLNKHCVEQAVKTGLGLRAQIQSEMSKSLMQDLNETFVLGLRSEVDYKRDDAAIQTYIQGMIGDKAQP